MVYQKDKTNNNSNVIMMASVSRQQQRKKIGDGMASPSELPKIRYNPSAELCIVRSWVAKACAPPEVPSSPILVSKYL